MIQAPAVAADTFPHLADTVVRGVVATLPGGKSLSAVVVIGAIVLVNVILVLAAMRGFKAAGGIKSYLADFPSHNASTALALILIFETGLVVLIRLALGLVFPDNYETWTWALVALAGVNVAGLGVKRFTDDKYVAAKAAGKAMGDTGQFPAVNVEGNATVNTQPATTTEHRVQKTTSVTFGGESQ